MGIVQYFRKTTEWGDFVERSADGLSVRIWANEAAYKARHAPVQGLGWSNIEDSRKFFADADVIDPAPEQDPIPEPTESDLAKAALAQRDLTGEDIRIVEELWDWAKGGGFSPSALAQKRVDYRKTLRSRITS